MAPEVAEAEVDVFPARTWAEIHKGLGRAVDSPEDGIECWRYPDPDGSYDCAVEYGNGWLLTAAAKPGLTGDRGGLGPERAHRDREVHQGEQRIRSGRAPRPTPTCNGRGLLHR